jgi:hypothetical protein
MTDKFNYQVEIGGVGLLQKSIYNVGKCSQIAVFKRIGDKKPIELPTVYNLQSHIKFPFFEQDGFTDTEILQEIRESTTHLITDWDKLSNPPRFSFDAYWSQLTIRQKCKNRSRMTNVFQSENAAEYFKVDFENEIVEVLFQLEKPNLFKWKEDDPVHGQSDAEESTESNYDDKDWGTDYTTVADWNELPQDGTSRWEYSVDDK